MFVPIVAFLSVYILALRSQNVHVQGRVSLLSLSTVERRDEWVCDFAQTM